MLWEFTFEQWIMSFAFICCCCFIGGWVADRIVGYAGFSVIGNWLLMLIGTYVGLLVYNMMGHRFAWDSQMTLAMAFGSAFAMLFVMLSVKAMLRFR